jgi:hypothetical protein
MFMVFDKDKHFGVLFKQDEVKLTMAKVMASCDKHHA